MTKIALIGAGRMGGALLAGWIKAGTAPADVTIIDPAPGPQARNTIAQGAVHAAALTTDNAKDLDVVLLGIKPQMFAQLGPEIAKALPAKSCIVSILAGTTQSQLSAMFGQRPIIRTMPNTPAAIGKGITAYIRNERVSEGQASLASQLLSAGGDVIEVKDESLIDVVTAVSGSGPAYIFHMVEALEAAAIRAGMPKDLAGQLARKTVTGSGALLEASDQSASELRVAVTSPGGTTQAALEVLMGEDGLPQLMRRTVAAAAKRSKELGAD